MTQVSRIPLSKTFETELFEVFYGVLADLRTPENVSEFLDDLLSPTEKIMLGKRLAIALFLERGYDHRTIQDILHVSTGTVSGVHYWLKNKGVGYKKAIAKILREERWMKRLEKIDRILEHFFEPKRLVSSTPPSRKSYRIL